MNEADIGWWFLAFVVGFFGFASFYAHWAAWHDDPGYFYGGHKSGWLALACMALTIAAGTKLEGVW